jgi:C4-dicarboxylate-specific signal transduction histidine kinase
VLHKRNGHRRAPGTKDLSLGEMMRLVHSVRDQAPKPTFDLLKFADVVRSEKASALLEQASRQIDGIQLALGAVLAQTQSVFARGELADVRAALEAFRAQADLAGRLMAKLVATAGTRTTERRVVALNDVLGETLELLQRRLDAGVAVASHLDPELPRIVGNARQLQQVFVALLSHMWRMAAGPRPGQLVVRTAHAPGAVQGEDVVRVEIGGDGPGLSDAVLGTVARAASGSPDPEDADLDLYLAVQIVTEHGGAVSADNLPEGGARFTVELPAM